MNKKVFNILLIEDSRDYADLVRRWLSLKHDTEFIVKWADSLTAGLALLPEGGVDAILLDLGLPESQGSETFTRIKSHAPGVPIVILSAEDGESDALEMVQQGAQDYIIKSACSSAVLVKALQYAIGRSSRKGPGSIIALLGGKGGVGTTTIGLNIACILARRSTVVLVEMRPTFGTLASYLQPQGVRRNLSHLLSSTAPATIAGEAEAALWAYKSVPGLRILFGPQPDFECAEIGAAEAKAIVQSLARVADYVIVDLPPSLSEANRAVLEESRSMAIIVERSPVCVRLAGMMVQALKKLNARMPTAAAIIVNRASASSPMPLSEIDALLGCAVSGVIPPDPDLCLRAQNAGAPLVTLDPESFISDSLIAISEALAPTRSAVPARS